MLWLVGFASVAVTATALYVVTTIQDSFDGFWAGNDDEIEKPTGYPYFNTSQKMLFFLNSLNAKAWGGIAFSVFLIVKYSTKE
jgi:uncharacterized membrane protein